MSSEADRVRALQRKIGNGAPAKRTWSMDNPAYAGTSIEAKNYHREVAHEQTTASGDGTSQPD